MKMPWRYQIALLMMAGLLLVWMVYQPGLSGPWLVDDDVNLGGFKTLQADTTSYSNIIFSNTSGPLGRSVSMASFAANHALGLFSTPALKTTGLILHMLNGMLVFMVLGRLFRIKAPALPSTRATSLAAIIAIWWMLLPLNISSVLYIVQRMTLLASFFSLATVLVYVIGREVLQRKRNTGMLLIGTGLLILFPLAIFSKESAFSTIAWLVLIEIFFFAQTPVWRIGLKPVLTVLVTITIACLALLALLPQITNDYILREFTLLERLLTQARVIWSYISDIFIPDSGHMGVFQDDYTVSRGMLSPWTTLAGMLGLAGMLILAIRLATTAWWAVSFGVMFYLSGHLLESTVLPLEIYFEHRNYLPSVGLLVAAASATTMLWKWRTSLLAIAFSLYLGLLAFSTLQRNLVWANKSLLLETSAINHPHSLRAWTDYSEDLLVNRKPRMALEAALQAANNNPEHAGIYLMQMISFYCRINVVPPDLLIRNTADQLQKNTSFASSFTTPLGIGLENILSYKKSGGCQNADFSALAPALVHIDQGLIHHYGNQRENLWFLRLTLAEWLLETGNPKSALHILRDAWATGDKSAMPMTGLALARTLTAEKSSAEALEVLAELATVTHDAPADFRAEATQLEQRNTGAK